MTAIKLGIAGSHSTGKTSFLTKLAQELSDRRMRVRRVGDLGTEARKCGFAILRDHSFESTLWIMSRGISEELKGSLESDIVLVDRSVPDALGYLFAAHKLRGTDLSHSQRDYLLNLAMHHGRTYDIHCKTKLDPNIPLAPGRDQDMNFRELVAVEIDNVFSMLSLEHQVVDSKNDRISSFADDLVSMVRENQKKTAH